MFSTVLRRTAVCVAASASQQVPRSVARCLHTALPSWQDAAAAPATPATPTAPPADAAAAAPVAAAPAPSSSSSSQPREVPAPPDYCFPVKRRGFVSDDPLPTRPPEDDVAAAAVYFEILVAYTAKLPDGPEKSLKNVTDRVKRLMDPANLTMLLNTFAVRGVKCPPEVASIVEGKFMAEPALLDVLENNYLCSLAFGFGCSQVGSKAFFETIAKRAAAIGTLEASDAANLKVGLDFAGVAMPAEVKVVPDAKLDLPEKW